METNQPVSFFREFTTPDIEEIKSFSKPTHLSKDELFFSQDDGDDSFYIIDNGEVFIFYSDNGTDKVQCTLFDCNERDFSFSTILDAIRRRFNCDDTHIVSTESYQQFFKDNLVA